MVKRSNNIMEGNEIIQEKNKLGSLPQPAVTVAIAINGKTESKYVVWWALEKFVTEKNVVFKLLHVRARVTAVPTAMGNSVPLSQVRDHVVAAQKNELDWQATEMLLPYKKMCLQRKVQVEVLVIESDDVANATAEEVSKHRISNLVIGAPSRSIFARKLNKHSVSLRISACTPSFCTVYAVSKGKLLSVRPSDPETNGSSKDDSSETSCLTNSSSSHSSTSQTDSGYIASYSYFCSPSLPVQRFQALSTVNHLLLHKRASSVDTNSSGILSLDFEERKNGPSSCLGTPQLGPGFSQSTSWRTAQAHNFSWISDQASTFYPLIDCSSESQVDVDFELEKLRIELRHFRGMYAMAQTEAIDASRKLSNLSQRRWEQEMKLKELKIKEKEAEELAMKEKEKYEAAKWEAEYVKERVEREASQRREAEMKAAEAAKEKEKLENALGGPLQLYQKFTWEEIVAATSSFSEKLKIGTGANGTVYKCNLHHTTAAVKVLHSKENKMTKQFQQELEILSKIRHPHLLLLLGACPEQGCLVYEYMENSSLEERLLHMNNAPSIPWFERYRIAWEVASALVFLHNLKPAPIIHRDLKPANILLDHNFVSKIGDIGLSTMVHSEKSTICKNTAPVGTLCYIDPEYQRTGLISLKSDVYAFGIVILQLLTGKPAMALTHMVETAITDDNLSEILDSKAGSWPNTETWELATLGLTCAELRRKDRPDLKNQVLPALERLKKVADRARNSINKTQVAPPNHFFCPILKDIMNDPCVASDGYTYDRKAIENWLEENDKSPVTNLPLPNKNLLNDCTLLFAITEWKSKKLLQVALWSSFALPV